MEGGIQELVAVLFKPTSMQKFELGLEGVDTTKELFGFCIDLLTQGITHVYGIRADPTRLSSEEFAVITTCMARAGIRVHIEPVIDQTEEGAAIFPISNIADIPALEYALSSGESQNLPLIEYSVVLRSSKTGGGYRIRFELQNVF